MVHPAANSPTQDLVQYLAIAAGTIGVAIAAFLNYFRRNKPLSPREPLAVVSASFADKAVIEKLIQALDHRDRADKLVIEALDDLRRTVRDVSEDREDESKLMIEALRQVSTSFDALLGFQLRRDREKETPLHGGAHLLPED